MCRQWTRRVLARFLTPLVLSLLLSAVQGKKGSTKLAPAVRNEEVAPVTLKLPKRAGAACADAAGGSVCGRELVSVVTPTRGKTQNYPGWGFITREMPSKSVDKRARKASSPPPVGAEGTGAGVGKRRQLQSNRLRRRLGHPMGRIRH